MDTLQFYGGPPRKKSLTKRKKRIHPLQCEIDDIEDQAAREAPTTSKNETDEVQLQSQSKPQFNIPRTVYLERGERATLIDNLDIAFSTSANSISSQSVAHEPPSSISDSTSKAASYHEFSAKEGTEIEQSVSFDSSGETGVDSAEPPACESISLCAIEGIDRRKQSHDNAEHATEKSGSSLEAKNTGSSMPHFGISLPCHESNHPLLSHPDITSCEACTFKDGQLFALVQILHSFHRGPLRIREAEVVSKPQKKLPKGLFASTFSLNLIRTVIEASRSKDHQGALRPHRRIKRSKGTEAEMNARTICQGQLSPRTCTRSGRVSKATQKLLHSAL